jgi:cytochrome c nitrite reductase small subunit
LQVNKIIENVIAGLTRNLLIILGKWGIAGQARNDEARQFLNTPKRLFNFWKTKIFHYFCSNYLSAIKRKMKIRDKFIAIFASRRQKIIVIILAGIICGLGGYTAYAFRIVSYLSDDPATCMNCHIMAPYYATWSHSSHAQNATCNDCHVPHENIARKWLFKGKDGTRHATVFLMKNEPQVIQAIEASSSVIMHNCIRCHEQLNTEFIKAGRISYHMAKMGEGKSCWDCHREVVHGRNSLSSTPNSLVPYPKAMIPDWLKKSSNQ